METGSRTTVRRIFVVDDHPIMRAGYRFLLDAEDDLTVCGEAGSAREALELIPEVAPDLVIVDISLGGMNGIGLVKSLLSQDEDLKALVVSAHDESTYGERAILAGARGYVMKTQVDETIVEAIRRVLRGGFFVSEQMLKRIVHQFQLQGSPAAGGNGTSISTLSDRELEIFELIGEGMSTAEIADALIISPKTVESHRGRIKKKLSIATTTELLQKATIWVEQQP